MIFGNGQDSARSWVNTSQLLGINQQRFETVNTYTGVRFQVYCGQHIGEVRGWEVVVLVCRYLPTYVSSSVAQ